MKNILLFVFSLGIAGRCAAQHTDIPAAVNWVNQNAIPLNSVDAESGFDDLQLLDRSIGDARIVGMGECTHGSSEVFRMKHRMLEYLVKEKGFTIFSIEANMPEAYALNQYIIEGKGDPRKLLAGMYFWTWDTQEVLDMILWMKKYNDTAANKIMFTGFDMQFINVAAVIVRNYLNRTAPELLSPLNDIDSLQQVNITNKTFQKGEYPFVKNDAQQLLDRMAGIKHGANDTSYAWAVQNAKILWQYGCDLHDKELRDKFMAENLEWIAAQNPNAKIMVWAHNEHIRKDKRRFAGYCMGNYLKQAFGSKYIAVGFSTETGTYTAYKKGAGIDSANILLPSKKQDCEFIFKNTAHENFVIDLRKASSADEDASWIFERTAIRTLGAGTNDKFQFGDINPSLDFDLLIFLRKTNSSKCFDIRKPAGSVPE